MRSFSPAELSGFLVCCFPGQLFELLQAGQRFFVIFFAGLFFLFPDQLVALTGKEADAYHPLFRLAASAPTLSAFLVILGVRGKQGLLVFWARYLDFGIRLRWYVLVFGGIVGLGLVLRYLEKSWGLQVPELPFSLYSFPLFAA